MAPRVLDRRSAAPDPWERAPVASGRHHRHGAWLLVAALVLLVVGVVALLLTGREVPVAGPLRPADAPPVPPASEPFGVTVEVTSASAMDHDALLGGAPGAPPAAAVADASDEVAEMLRAYLDAQFVTPQTRFGDAVLPALLTPEALAALDEDDLGGLGVLDVDAVAVRAEPLTARARVLTDGGEAALVALRYDARAQVLTGDGDDLPLHQRATMVLLPADGGWRVAAVDARLRLRAAEEAPR